MYVEAYMGGGLHKCGESGEFEALSTKAATTFDAAKELVKKFGHMGRENLYRQFRMNAPGWKVIDWRATTPREVGLEEMARSLAGRGWPLPKETLEAWREYASDFDRDSDGAEPFAAWIESLAVKAELEAHGAVLQGKGGQSTKSRI
jgi:hypothetical protein